jgi:cellulose synthase/poly-beta-1,6-N-acetylglucosamine synthase-like glycosyltransferase
MIALSAIAALTAIYLILGHIGLSRLNSERAALPSPREWPLVSIIIPAYNAQKTISDTLKSVASLDYPRKEIIVVNDSSDSTPSIARSFNARVIQNKKRQGKPASLNIAAKAAKGSLLFFLDADTIASRDCLRRMVPWFSQKGVAAVMPRYLLRNGGVIPKLASLENLFTFTLLRIHMFFGSMIGFRGCSVLIKKSVLEKNPWPETLMEDNHLSATLASLGHSIIWEPLAVTRTSEPGTIRELRKQKTRWGEGAIISFLGNWRFYTRSPQFMIFFYPYFALGITMGLLILAFLLSPILIPNLTTTIGMEILLMSIGMYFHSLIFFNIGGGGLPILNTLWFMTIYFPLMTASYFRGLLRGIKRKKRGLSELHFRDW